MSKTLTASDRSRLIHLASTLPVGSDERRVILSGLKKAASLKSVEAAAGAVSKAQALGRSADKRKVGVPYNDKELQKLLTPLAEADDLDEYSKTLEAYVNARQRQMHQDAEKDLRAMGIDMPHWKKAASLKREARDNRFDHEGKDFGVTIQASGGYGSQYVTLYWPLENVGIMRRKVNTRRVNWGYDKDRISRTAWAHTMLDRLKKASNINAAQRILDQNIKEMRDTEDLNYFHDEVSEVKAHDKQLPVPSHRIIEDIEGGDITVEMNGPDLNFYSKSESSKWQDQRMTYYFTVKKRYQKKVNAVRDLLEKARGLDQVKKILTAVKVPWDSQIYSDPMWS